MFRSRRVNAGIITLAMFFGGGAYATDWEHVIDKIYVDMDYDRSDNVVKSFKVTDFDELKGYGKIDCKRRVLIIDGETIEENRNRFSAALVRVLCKPAWKFWE